MTDKSDSDIVEWLRRAEETPTPSMSPHYERKFDYGKADYTLLPYRAVAAVLEHELALSEESELVVSPDDKALLDSVGRLMGYMATEAIEDLLDACVLSFEATIRDLAGVVDILEYGARKYARDSWRMVPDGKNRYYSAAMRHAQAVAADRSYDVPEGEPDVASPPSADGKYSGMDHLSHYRCNLLFLLGLHLGE